MPRRREQSAQARIAGWRREHNMVAIGNLGEQIALRLLHRWDYQILATQEDLRGLPSPIEGELDGQVLKVDLMVMLAQLFEFDDRRRAHACGAVQHVSDDVMAVLHQFPDGPPPPPLAFDVDDL
jgi:hypothetical protein